MQSSMSPKAQRTRERILGAAAGLIHAQGYHDTGLQQILDAAQVTKGAFYFHFKDKKALALEVIQFFRGMFSQQLGVELSNPRLGARQRLQAFHEASRAALAGSGAMCGCPLGNLTLELAGVDPDFRRALADGFDQMVAAFALVIAEGQRSGEIQSALPPDQLADFFVSSWEGAVLRAKAAQSLAPLDIWFSMMCQVLVVSDPPAQSAS